MKVTTPADNQINFGFNYNTHRKVAEKLIKEEFPVLQKYSTLIERAVVAPDFDELGFHSNTHFYYPFANFIKPRESFLDFYGVHNARNRYNFHLSNFFELLSCKQYNLMASEAGRAKHFLDDMCMGLHVKGGNFMQKWNEYPVHCAFENFIYRNEDSFLAQTAPTKAPVKRCDTFEDILMSVAEYSANMEMPDKKNIHRWPLIAQNSVNLLIEASREFFARISGFIK